MDWQQLMQLITPAVESSLSGLPFYTALLAIGLGIGVLTGFFGVGGGFLVVPILNVLLGINYEIAVGSSLSFIIGTSFAGLVKQRKLGNVHFRVAGYIIIGSVLGAVLGDSLQMFLLYGLAGGNTEMFTVFMHSIFIVVLIGTIFAMRTPGESETAQLPLLARLGPGPKFQIEEWGSHGFSVPGSFIVGLLIGIFTGLLGHRRGCDAGTGSIRSDMGSPIKRPPVQV
ncbi:MAG: sulfite exporter TauE/SafE family protein [Spirochaetia bacterium]|nr:sulfite exporter TauE/SafE family protein [Spirochaetia bacterium]